MRIYSVKNNIQANNQQSFGMVNYNGDAIKIKSRIGRKFGKAASDALELLEKRHGDNAFSDINIDCFSDPRFERNVLVCYAGLRADNVTEPLSGFPRVAITKEGVLNLLYGTSQTLSKLATELEKKTAGLAAEGEALLMYPAPLVASRLTKATVVPDWQGVMLLA